MNKKSLILLPALMMILASCNNNSSSTTTTSKGDNSSTSETSNGDSTTSEQTPIGVNYGTLENPLSVSEFATEVGKLGLENGEYSDALFFVTGYAKTTVEVKDDGTFNATRIGEEVSTSINDSLTIGYFKAAETVTETFVCTNDKIIIEGYAERYNDKNTIFAKTLEDESKSIPVLHKVTRGTAKVTKSIDNGTISADLKESYTNGETATFTVEANEGYSIDSVKVYDKTLEADKTTGKYSFVVKGDVTVEVKTKSTADTSKTLTLDFVTNVDAYAEAIGGQDTASKDLKEAVLDGITYSYIAAEVRNTTYDNGKYLFLRSNKLGTSGLFANKTAIGGKILSVTLKTNKGASDKAAYNVTFGETAIVKADVTVSEAIPGASEKTFESDKGYSFFAISTTTDKNCQLVSISIKYQPAA